jgi:hypothetical protein
MWSMDGLREAMALIGDRMNILYSPNLVIRSDHPSPPDISSTSIMTRPIFAYVTSTLIMSAMPSRRSLLRLRHCYVLCVMCYVYTYLLIISPFFSIVCLGIYH